MTALPFDLPAVSRGFAALTPSARRSGERLARCVEAALADVLGATVTLAARPVPAPAGVAPGFARVAVTLAEIPSTAWLEIDAALLARVLGRMMGRPAAAPAALAATPLESALLVVLALVAADAARGSDFGALSPLVELDGDDGGAPQPRGLAILLDVGVGADRGRGRLVVPTVAVERLAGPPELSGPIATARFEASLRHGTISLEPADLVALAPGDVVLLDESAARAAVVIPGGMSIVGRLEGTTLAVEEIRMNDAQASYPITLSVEIARVRLTLGDLARLAPGAAVVLDARKDGAVVLRAGEQAIARGQLVDVEGALGVRIAQVGDAA